MSMSIQPTGLHGIQAGMQDPQETTKPSATLDDVEPEMELNCTCTRCRLSVLWMQLKEALRDARTRLIA